MSDGVVLVMRAALFAAQAHTGQTRKGVLKEPYLNHLAEVAALLAEATGGEDAGLIAAGWLHDTVEDCGVTPVEIAELFGDDVAALVVEVTDDKTLPKAVRKRRQVETVAGKSVRARILKLADKTSNVGALVSSPPEDWTTERLDAYVAWASEVVDTGCRGLNMSLEAKFDAAAARARVHFAADGEAQRG